MPTHDKSPDEFQQRNQMTKLHTPAHRQQCTSANLAINSPFMETAPQEPSFPLFALPFSLSLSTLLYPRTRSKERESSLYIRGRGRSLAWLPASYTTTGARGCEMSNTDLSRAAEGWNLAEGEVCGRRERRRRKGKGREGCEGCIKCIKCIISNLTNPTNPSNPTTQIKSNKTKP